MVPGTATDSGYASLPQVLFKEQLQPVVENLTSSVGQGTDCNDGVRNLDRDDMQTLYSASHHLDADRLDVYKSELADSLINRLQTLDLATDVKEHMADILPDMLKGFALRLGQHSTTKSEHEVMYFVHKYRQ